MTAPTILIVEDDMDTRLYYTLTLRSAGYEIAQAEDGEAALRELQGAVKPALILLDLTLPHLSGEELMVRLRAEKHGADVPVVVLSGWDGLAKRAATMGAQGYLRKPCELDDLLALVERHVGTPS